MYPRIVIAGTNNGIDKTILSIGLLIALKRRGLDIQPYKCGPDITDSALLSYISGNNCRNLDSFLLQKNVILELFENKSRNASFSLIEGIMGIFDGVEGHSDFGSTADIAKILDSPVILIIESGKLAKCAGDIASGYQNFNRGLRLVGFIIHGVSSSYRFNLAKEDIERRTGIPVLGYLPNESELLIPEKLTGIISATDINIQKYLTNLGDLIEKSIDIDAILGQGEKAPPLPPFKISIFDKKVINGNVTIAVAQDRAFFSYYDDNLEILKFHGADLIYFSPLKSKKIPPSADGIYIGSGFPEMYASNLSWNSELRENIKELSNDGMPIYAECSGLMYLMDKLVDFDGREFPMAGIFPGIVKIGKGLHLYGYHDIECVSNNILSQKGDRIIGYISEWSYVENMPRNQDSAFMILKISVEESKTQFDGFIRGNTLASYIHFHFGNSPSMAKNFIKNIYNYKLKKEKRP